MRHARLIAVILFLVVVFAFFELSGLRAHLSLDFLRQQLLDNKLGGLLVFILLFTLGNLIQIPGWLFLAAAVLTLGKFWGGVATYVAACVSCAAIFFTIRFLGGDALRKLDGRVAVRLLRHLDARPAGSVLLLRMLFQTAPALNFALAMSGVPFRAYLTGTLLGLPLPIAAYCIFFDYLAKAFGIG
jgi:uncharacterized membrane protein YdjX (TVP38/TMEM64 family)